MMKCSGCGAELAEGTMKCTACGRDLSMGQKAFGETVHVAKETEAVAGKLGKELWGGAKALGASTKKHLKGSESDKK